MPLFLQTAILLIKHCQARCFLVLALAHVAAQAQAVYQQPGHRGHTFPLIRALASQLLPEPQTPGTMKDDDSTVTKSNGFAMMPRPLTLKPQSFWSRTSGGGGGGTFFRFFLRSLLSFLRRSWQAQSHVFMLYDSMFFQVSYSCHGCHVPEP